MSYQDLLKDRVAVLTAELAASRQEAQELRALLHSINERVIPGETDSVDGLREILVGLKQDRQMAMDQLAASRQEVGKVREERSVWQLLADTHLASYRRVNEELAEARGRLAKAEDVIEKAAKGFDALVEIMTAGDGIEIYCDVNPEDCDHCVAMHHIEEWRAARASLAPAGGKVAT